ncbi:MAG TPA: iron-containing redox enzyme family protein [Kofleriaceae bacterium]|nr:iron-containing redox enzyme family protein [Kofleriaceae bacterium]
MTFSGDLFATLDVARDGVSAVSSELCGSDDFPRLLPEWFSILWDVIRATTPVLQRAIGRLQQMPQDDFHRALLDFYLLKITEESGHDEMLATDLAKLGVPRESLVRRLPPAPIAAMVGSQYYLIDHVHPAAYLGYLAMLEGYPADTQKLSRAIEQSGAPPEAWSTYRMHAEVDTWHRQEIADMLDLIPDDATIRGAIVSNGLRTADYYCQALDTLVARATKIAA